ETDVADTVILSYETSYKTRVAIFNFSSKSGVVSIEIADGIYKDCLTNKEVVVQDGKVQLDVRAIVFDIAK
ncbi:alpha-amylase, partial [Acinetobacter baumannii]